MDAPKGSDPGHRGRRRPRDGSDDGSDATLRPGQVGSARAGGIGLASADPGELSRQSIVDDPRRARLAAIRSALAEARLGAASSAIERLRRDGSALTEFSELAGQVERRVAGACVSLAAHLQAGEVLRARALLRELLEPSSPATIAAVERVCAEHGWPSLTGEPVQHAIVGADAVPTWRGLKDGRVVRAVRGGETVRTRIVAATDNGITLRVVGRDGVTFPTVAAWTVEPEAVKAAEAAELGLAALAVGAQRYARLWCVCGLLRASQPVPRLDLLRQLLR